MHDLTSHLPLTITPVSAFSVRTALENEAALRADTNYKVEVNPKISKRLVKSVKVGPVQRNQARYSYGVHLSTYIDDHFGNFLVL